MLPRDNGDFEIRLAEHRLPADEPGDYLCYLLIAATVMVGVVLAIIFVAF
jgi:hypothetical protein